MAFNKKNSNGLDLSGVGAGRLSLGGGNNRGARLSLGASSARSGRAAGRQMPPSSFSADAQGHGAHTRTVVMAVVGVVLAIALAVGVGVFVYRQSIQNAFKPEVSKEVASVLTAAEEDRVVWSLLAVNTYNGEATQEMGLQELALVAFDPANLKVSVLWVPAQLRVYVAGYGYKSLSEAYAMEDDPTFVKACSDVTGVSFAHYFELSRGGIDAYLAKLELPDQGSKELVASAIIKKLVGTASEQLSDQLALLEKYLGTDMSSKELSALVTSMRGMDAEKDIHNESMPLEDSVTPEGYALSKTGEWATMSKRVSEGLNPVAGKAEINKSEAIRANAKVTIWNGVGVSGIAHDCAEHLKKKGWGLESTGNAASFVYEETLIVYTYDADRPMAELLVSDLGQGRAVRSAARYSFEGDILVVVGKDYQPY